MHTRIQRFFGKFNVESLFHRKFKVAAVGKKGWNEGFMYSVMLHGSKVRIRVECGIRHKHAKYGELEQYKTLLIFYIKCLINF